MAGAAANMARVWMSWAKRRGGLFWYSFLYSLGTPKKMWAGIADHREGAKFFADPLGKPSVFTYWRNLAEMSYSSLFLQYRRPTEEGFAAAKNVATETWGDDGITVLDKELFLEFKPAEGACAAGAGDRPLVGVLILPGALVSPTAYAPLARTMAQKGYPTFILRFEFNISLFGWERARDIVTLSNPPGEGCSESPSKWLFVGHSAGTIAIENLYTQNPNLMDGVVYMGSGNMIGEALKDADVPALVIRGSRDPFCPAEALAISAKKMPKGAETVVVEGGNHRGFASYTWQPLDWEATITQQEQRHQVVEALIDFIKRKVAP